MNRIQFDDHVDGLGHEPETLHSGGLISVQSSNLYGIGYEFDSKTLVVAFTNGGAYQYEGVSPFMVVELLSAGSHGSFFHHNIRMSYAFSRL